MANLGHLDSDDFEDFGVGAPFHGPQKEGAILIYRGSKTFTFTGVT